MAIALQSCGRCGAQCYSTCGSVFDEAQICPQCSTRERVHPLYEIAREAVAQACRRGEFNFPGVGLPLDLR